MNRTSSKFLTFFLLISYLLFFSCIKDNELTKKDSDTIDNPITSFFVLDGRTVIRGSNINITLKTGTSIDSIAPIITLKENLKISPSSLEAVNFSEENPKKYLVTFADGSKREFLVTIDFNDNVKSNDNTIKSFKIAGIDGVIDNSNNSIEVVLANDSPLLVKPNIEIHPKSSISPTSEDEIDFSDGEAKTYIVTAEDGSVREYSVTVKLGEIVSGNFISSFIIPNATETIINNDINQIDITIPFTTNFIFSPIINTSKSASVIPNSEEEVDFDNDTKSLTYEVTSVDGSKRTYTVKINVLPPDSSSTDEKILSFSINGGTTVIDEEKRTIEVTVPAGYFVDRLKPTYTTTNNATVSPLSGDEIDFSTPQLYNLTDTAKNVTVAYTVTVNKDVQTCAQASNIVVESAEGSKHYELVSENKTWEEAKVCAENRGGYLVNINNSQENDLIESFATSNISDLSNTVTTKEGINSNRNQEPHIWLGGTEPDGLFKNNDFIWTQDTQIFHGGGLILGINDGPKNGKYNNWVKFNGLACRVNEPDSGNLARTKVAMALEDYINGIICSGDSKGGWIDADNNNKLYYVIEYDQNY